MPDTIVSWLSQQLNVDHLEYERSRWKSSLWDIHLASIRSFTGFRPCNEGDNQGIVQWLVNEARSYPSRSMMFSAAIQRYRQLRIELPVEKKLQRLVNSAWQQYLSITCRNISERFAPEIREKMDQCLNPGANDKDRYEWLKAHPGKFGVKSLLGEINRLQFVNEFEVKAALHLKDIPDEVLKLLRERADPELAYHMRRHPPNFRYALLAALLGPIAGIGAEIVRQVVEKAFDYLDGAPRVLGGKSIPMPFAPALEKACTPQKEDIIKAVREMVS